MMNGAAASVVKVTREPSKGGRPARITEAMKNQIVTLYNDGKTGREIAEIVGVSTASVYRIIKQRR